MNMKSGIIYKWKCLENGKEYIGQTSRPNRRKNAFLAFDKNYSGNAINRARIKYDDEKKWEYTILEKIICENSEKLKIKLNDLEKKYIKEYNTLVPNGYNITDGGGGIVVNGSIGYWNGRPRDEDTKRKIGNANRDTKHSRESIERGVRRRKENPNYDEIVRKINLAKKGKTRIKIYQYNKLGELVGEYNSIEEASKKTNVRSSGICYAVYTKYKGKMDYGGFLWSNKKLSNTDIIGYDVSKVKSNRKGDIFLYDINFKLLGKFKTQVELSKFLSVTKRVVHYILQKGNISDGIWYKEKFILDKKIEEKQE